MICTEEFNQKGEQIMSVISMKQLLEARVHFGHQTFFFNDNLST